MRGLILFVLLLILMAICPPIPQSTGFGLGVGYAVEGYGHKAAMTGAKWTKIAGVAWGLIEPEPPENGLHSYHWERLDNLVREYQREGFEIIVVLKAANPWGCTGFEPLPESWRASYPPKADRWGDYAHFVTSVVERYDGDGIEDMPGLLRPIRYWEIESEAQHRIFWKATAGEYIKLLQTAYQAAKSANPEAKIILAGINFGDIFSGGTPPAISSLPPGLKREADFILKTLSATGYYDAIDIHYNRDYKSIIPAVEWLRQRIPQTKEIWAGDACSVPWCGGSMCYPEETLRKLQASLTVKKILTAAELGLRGIIIESLRDFPKDAYNLAPQESWQFAGIFDKDGTPRPVFYAYRQIAEVLKDGSEVEAKEVGGCHLSQVLHRGGKTTYILWCDREEEKNLTLDVACGSVQIEHLALSEDRITEEKEATDGHLTIKIGELPVFLECLPPR